MAAPTHRAGGSVEDYCRACKTDRMHTVVVADAEGHAGPGGVRLLPQRAQLPRRPPGRTGIEGRKLGGRHHVTGARAGEARGAERAGTAGARQRAGADWPAGISGGDRHGYRDAAAPDHPRGSRHHRGHAGREVARRHARAAPREPVAAGEELADRDLLPQGRDAAEPAAHAGAAGQRGGAARRISRSSCRATSAAATGRSPASTSCSPTTKISSRARGS